jgi:hypothetical protein
VYRANSPVTKTMSRKQRRVREGSLGAPALLESQQLIVINHLTDAREERLQGHGGALRLIQRVLE